MMKRLVLLLAVAVGAGACASAQARAPEKRPALVVPPAPPRVIEPLPPTEPPELEPVPELPVVAPVPPRRPAPPRDTKATDPKQEPKPETPPDPTAAAPPAATPAAPVPPLRTAETADGPEAQRLVRETIDRTHKMLGSINYAMLGNEKKANYDAAVNFLKQADEAIKTNKLVFAKSLADRAEMMAKELSGR